MVDIPEKLERVAEGRIEQPQQPVRRGDNDMPPGQYRAVMRVDRLLLLRRDLQRREVVDEVVDALLGALRTARDRAMVLAMLLGGLRRCEVLGLRLVPAAEHVRDRHQRQRGENRQRRAEGP